MKWCLRPFGERDIGSVSALAVNDDCSRCLAGYSRGRVALWNLQSGDLMNTFSDLHAPTSCVLHIKVSFYVLTNTITAIF